MFHKVTFWIASIMYVFFNERVTKLDIMRHIFKVNLFHLYLSFLAMLYGVHVMLAWVCHACSGFPAGDVLLFFFSLWRADSGGSHTQSTVAPRAQQLHVIYFNYD